MFNFFSDKKIQLPLSHRSAYRPDAAPSPQKRQRLAFLDYAKALSIFYVVFIHVGFDKLNEAALFIMPLFFAATGYSFTPGKRSFGENVCLRFKAVIIPFWCCMALYTLIEALRAPLLGYGSWKVVFPSLANLLYGSGIIPFDGKLTDALKEIMSFKAQVDIGADVILASNCHLWFLPAMFSAYVFFAALAERTQKSHAIKPAVIAALVLIASLESVFPRLCQLPYGIGRGALGAAYMLIGFWLKNGRVLENRSRSYYLSLFALSALVYAGALALGSTGSVLVRSYYGPYGVWSVFITLIGGTAGILLLLILCLGVEKLPFEKLKSGLSFTGRNVFTVYSLHMAVKSVFDVIYVRLLHPNDAAVMDEFYMGLLPDRACVYMIFEAVAAIALCLLCAKWCCARRKNIS